MIRFACVDVSFIFYFLKIDGVEAGTLELFNLRLKSFKKMKIKIIVIYPINLCFFLVNLKVILID